jgi:eukaryotic-like serine/threonine-protein kinase
VAALGAQKRGGEQAFPGGHAPFAGKYVVERVLGQGGMGIVFEARHVRLGQRVAIKVLGQALRDYPELVARFEREARAAGELSSPHAVRVFDIDATEDGTPYMVMELLSGRDLAHVLESEGPQPVGRAVRWLLEACDAIAEAHRLGIVHRDLKPSNLFLAQADGRVIVKVLDFGIAKRASAKDPAITSGVAPLGTPQYMSPEQVRCAKDVDARTDIWSLGVTLYELLTNHTPFEHEESSATIASIAADPVPDPRTLRPDLPDALAEVVLRALRKDPKERFESVADLVEELAPFAEVDDMEISAVRRILAAPRTATPHVSTVDAPRRHLELLPDATVPPAVSRASVPGRRSWRPTIAAAVAVALGLGAVVATPKCVTEGSEAVARADEPHARGEALAPVPVAAPAALEVDEPEGDEAQARNDEAVPVANVIARDAPIAARERAAAAATTTATAPAPRPTTAPAPPKSRPTASPRPAAPLPRAAGATASPAHGGLTGPGF